MTNSNETTKRPNQQDAAFFFIRSLQDQLAQSGFNNTEQHLRRLRSPEEEETSKERPESTAAENEKPTMATITRLKAPEDGR